jgi:hypothetical protein
LKVKDAIQIFEKLEMEIREGRDTLAFFKWEGKIILWSKVPHKRGELKGKLKYFIRQQLKLNENQFKDLQDCKMWRKDYLEILKIKGLLPNRL